MDIFKQSVIEIFRKQVIDEYSKYKRNVFELQRIVGDIVEISQDFERELNKVSKKTKDGKCVIKENFFDNENDEQKGKINNELLEVKRCRNYVVHNCFRECNGQKIKTPEDDLFLQFAENTNLIKAWICDRKKSGGIDELKHNIENDWQDAVPIDFNLEPLYTNPSMLIKMDWVALKVVMTKYLMYEFLDRLNKNRASIFA